MYPGISGDTIIAQDRAVDLPIVTHPVSGADFSFLPGLPVQASVALCR